MIRYARAIFFLVSIASFASGQTFDELVVFGDSHSDTGNWNVDSSIPWFQYFEPGRFSNGPVWVEHLATQLNLSAPTPNRSSGTNYAWGGSRTGDGFDSNQFGKFPKLGSQVDQHLSNNTLDGNELIVLFIGHNDFGWGGEIDASKPVSNIQSEISALADAGGRHFLVPNLHPLGHLPGYRGGGREDSLDNLTKEFNDMIATELDNLSKSSNVSIYQVDFFGLVHDAIAAPAQFGLTNVTEPALNSGSPVTNADEYMYWDSDHFSTAFYGVMANEAAASILNAPSFLPADFDRSGTVNFADFLVLSNAFGNIVDPAGAPPDLDSSGRVDFPDFLILSSTFGQSVATVSAVPEPTACNSLILGGLTLGLLRARRFKLQL